MTDYKKDEMFCVADFWAIEEHIHSQIGLMTFNLNFVADKASKTRCSWVSWESILLLWGI